MIPLAINEIKEYICSSNKNLIGTNTEFELNIVFQNISTRMLLVFDNYWNRSKGNNEYNKIIKRQVNCRNKWRKKFIDLDSQQRIMIDYIGKKWSKRAKVLDKIYEDINYRIRKTSKQNVTYWISRY